MRVALFIPCYMDQFYPQVAIASLELLEKLGCEVFFPEKQTCCGQPMANSGYEHISKSCTTNFKEAFAGFENIVCPSGSCTLHVKEHIGLESNIYELTEFIYDVLKIKTLEGKFTGKVGFHQSCHGQRGLFLSQMSELNAKTFSKPGSLLSKIEGLSLIELSRKDECCGFGGTFCVTEEAVSVRMGKDRLKEHLAAGAEIISGGDTSCLMHLEGIIKRDKLPLKVLHIAEILNSAISKA
jgi:L-lactate dehydrogenase complex protein LldE